MQVHKAWLRIYDTSAHSGIVRTCANPETVWIDDTSITLQFPAIAADIPLIESGHFFTYRQSFRLESMFVAKVPQSCRGTLSPEDKRIGKDGYRFPTADATSIALAWLDSKQSQKTSATIPVQIFYGEENGHPSSARWIKIFEDGKFIASPALSGQIIKVRHQIEMDWIVSRNGKRISRTDLFLVTDKDNNFILNEFIDISLLKCHENQRVRTLIYNFDPTKFSAKVLGQNE